MTVKVIFFPFPVEFYFFAAYTYYFLRMYNMSNIFGYGTKSRKSLARLTQARQSKSRKFTIPTSHYPDRSLSRQVIIPKNNIPKSHYPDNLGVPKFEKMCRF